MDQARCTIGADSIVEEPGSVIQSGFPQVLLRLELRFLTRFHDCLLMCKEAQKDFDLINAYFSFHHLLEDFDMINAYFSSHQDFYGSPIYAMGEEGLDILVSSPNKFEQLQPKFRKICVAFLDSLKSMSCSSDDLVRVMDALVEHFLDLANLKPDVFVNFKIRVLVHPKKLIFMRNLVDFLGKRCVDRTMLEGFLDYVKKEWVQSAASFSLQCLLQGKGEPTLAQVLETAFPDPLQQKKFIFCTPEVVKMFLTLLRASKPSKSDTVQISEVVIGFVDFLLEGLAADLLKEYAEILKGNLLFMITFIMDPPTEEEALRDDVADGLLQLRVNCVLDEVISLIFSLDKDGLKVVDIYILQVEFVKLKLEIRELFYASFSKSLDCKFPRTNAMGYIDLFLENLKEMATKIGFAKDQVMIVQEKFISFKQFLKYIVELQTEREDLIYLGRRIISYVFSAEHVIRSCLVRNHPIWYDILRLSDVMEEIKVIEGDVKRYSDHVMYKTRLTTSSETISSLVPINQANTSRLEDDIMDLKDELMAINEKLIWGTKGLHIVSVVGMPGLGKTTIARKVYNDPSIIHHFHRRAWCCVSQVYKRRELYFDILTDVMGVNARQSYSGSTDDDLAEKLWKCLRQQRYLVILDDIWNLEAWKCIQQSFPDDDIGSRILFTSRIRNLMAQANLINCSVHPLRSLSDEESWEILKGKLSRIHTSPLDDELSEIAKNVAKNCQGLPLSVVLIAGILAGKGKEFWKQIECSTSSQVVSEMCMDALELSYKHLPDNLKPCFLYFGAFPEDTVLRAGKLISLWIAEGLIPRNDKRISLFKVAENYLSDLINRSLIIFEARSSMGGIKACRVHDILRDLCLAKIEDDDFPHWVHDSDLVSNHSSLSSRKYGNYCHLCTDDQCTSFVDDITASPFIHSLVAARKGQLCVSCPSTIFECFKCLNVLELEHISIPGGFPEEVTLLVLLRYLRIHLDTAKILPSIANLWNLEVLILKFNWDPDFSLPSTFWGMKQLRHVSIPWWRLTYGLEDYEYCQLEQLEILAAPFLQMGNETQELLRRLPRLRKLKCYFPFVSNSDNGRFPEMSHLTHLESLNVMGCRHTSNGEEWSRFIAFNFPYSLRKFTLKKCNLPWSGISIIEELPHLEVLKLRRDAFSGNRWHVEDGKLLKLKYLELQRLDIEEWTVDDDPFPCLEQLIVESCEFLFEIPSGLGYITTLKKIEMRECSRASNSARKIFEEQREYGNDLLEVVVDDEYLKQLSD